MSNYSAGHEAEKHAADYLIRQGYKILHLNWRTRYCEIDIIASKNRIAYLVEVKYRRSEEQGSGIDYITEKKLKQMTFAAQIWAADSGWNYDYRLAVIELTGNNYEVRQLLTEL